MLLLRGLTALALLVPLVSPRGRHAAFKQTRTDNLVFSDHLLFDTTVSSDLRCLALCMDTTCCVRVSYTGTSGTPGRCRGHYTQLLSSHEGTSAPGTKTYVWTEVFGADLGNVARGRPARQKNTRSPNTASKAVDGNYNADARRGGCSHTRYENAWWQVDLGHVCVLSLTVTNRGDCCAHRLSDFDVHVTTADPATNPATPRTLCLHYDGTMAAGVTEELTCVNGPIRGRFLRVTNPSFLTLCEVEVTAVPAV